MIKLKNLLCFLFILGFFLIFNVKANAEQFSVNIKEIGASENIQLKTVKNIKDYYFTKPKYWQLNGNTKLVMTFSHSLALLPELSYINILINDHVIKTIQLTKGNAESTTVSIPIPINTLKDYNKISFEVNQHYTYECEDPFHSSLWTTVLNTSFIQFNFTKAKVPTDLARFPYPIYDDLSYTPTTMNFVVPEPHRLSAETLKSYALVDASIAQKVAWKKLNIKITDPTRANLKDNLIIVGTPEENPAIAKFQGLLPYKLAGNKLADSSYQPLDDDHGVLFMANNPANPSNVILFVTGNTPEAVLKAANALTQHPTIEILKGSNVVVKHMIPNKFAKLRDWKEYITTTKEDLIGLNHKSKTVRHITAPPIVYNIKLAPDMYMEYEDKAKLNVFYSYSSKLDRDLSQLEVKLNGVSLHSAKFDKDEGENFKKLTLNIPKQNIQTFNDLEFIFHIYPIKYDKCRFVADEQIWGTIHDNTYFELPAKLKAYLPNIGLINDGGFPFTAYPDMQNLVIVLDDSLNHYDFYSMLWTVARLAKQDFPTDSVNFSVVKYSDLTDSMKKNNNIIAIGKEGRFKFLEEIKDKVFVDYKNSNVKLKGEKKDKFYNLQIHPDLGIMEQILSPWDSKKIILTIYGKNDSGLENATRVFSDDKTFERISDGNIAIISKDTEKYIDNWPTDKKKELYTQDLEKFNLFKFLTQPWVMGLAGFILLIMWLGGRKN